MRTSVAAAKNVALACCVLYLIVITACAYLEAHPAGLTLPPHLQQRALLADAGGAGEPASDVQWSWGWRNWTGLTLSVLVSLISGPGGQGGASFYIPLFNVLLGFSVSDAAAMATFVVFLGCISSTGHAMVAPHPTNPQRTLIDWTTVLAMMPMLLMGVSFGVLANAVLAPWLLNTLLIGVWGWSIRKMAYALRNARAREARQRAEKAAATACTGAEADVEAAASAATATAGPPGDAGAADGEGTDLSGGGWRTRVRAAWVHARADVCAWAALQPWWAVSTTAVLFVGFVVLAVVRYVLAAPCSPLFWGLLAAQGAFLAVGGAGTSVVLVRSARRRVAAGEASSAAAPAADAAAPEAAAAPCDTAAASSPADAEQPLPAQQGAAQPVPASRRAEKAAARADAAAAAFALNEEAILWSPRRLAVMPPLMLCVGLLAGMLGIGGAAFVSPLILAWGLHPQVGAGTSKLVLMLSTGGAALSYLAAGRLNLAYVLVYGLVNVVVTPIGIFLMDWLVRRTGRPSHITALSLARFVAGVAVQLAFSAVPAYIVLATQHPPMAGFTPQAVCE